jgi:DNA invertase Pin-like site-specific DNA recombinase
MQTREQVDTSTPTGKMVFTVLGAVAELERSLIAERVRAGIRNARSKGKTLGRPRVAVDTSRIAALRAQGHSWGTIHRETGIGHKGLFMAFLRLLHHRLASIAETNLSVMLSMAARGADRR